MPHISRDERIWIPGDLTVTDAAGNPVDTTLDQWTAAILPAASEPVWKAARDNDGKPGWLVARSSDTDDQVDFALTGAANIRVRCTTATEILTADILVTVEP